MKLTFNQVNNYQDANIVFDLLNVLYTVEDQLYYKCKSVSKMIDYIQNNIKERSE